jgi:squalene cyclase
MAPGLWSDRTSSLAETLRSRQMKSGGWAYFDSVQESLEATCLAELALAPERQANSSAAIRFLLKAQLSDGGWPAFLGDSEGSWTTALALCTLNSTGDFTAAREKAFRWLYAERGREGHWFVSFRQACVVAGNRLQEPRCRLPGRRAFALTCPQVCWAACL